jgi:hypothetical protein
LPSTNDFARQLIGQFNENVAQTDAAPPRPGRKPVRPRNIDEFVGKRWGTNPNLQRAEIFPGAHNPDTGKDEFALPKSIYDIAIGLSIPEAQSQGVPVTEDDMARGAGALGVGSTLMGSLAKRPVGAVAGMGLMDSFSGTKKNVAPSRNEDFEQLGRAQRGDPEVSMLRVQKVIPGGVLPFVSEHVGDITHRMSEKFGYLGGQYDNVKDKVDKTLKTLTSDYGFAKEHAQNLNSWVDYHADPKNKTGILRTDGVRASKLSLKQQLSDKLDAALGEYAADHKKLRVYNYPQKWARDAAIEIGNKNWPAAIMNLRRLQHIMKSEDRYNDAVSMYYKDVDFSYKPPSKKLPSLPRKTSSGTGNKTLDDMLKKKRRERAWKPKDSPRELTKEDFDFMKSLGWDTKDLET